MKKRLLIVMIFMLCMSCGTKIPLTETLEVRSKEIVDQYKDIASQLYGEQYRSIFTTIEYQVPEENEGTEQQSVVDSIYVYRFSNNVTLEQAQQISYFSSLYGDDPSILNFTIEILYEQENLKTITFKSGVAGNAGIRYGLIAIAYLDVLGLDSEQLNSLEKDMINLTNAKKANEILDKTLDNGIILHIDAQNQEYVVITFPDVIEE